MPAPVETVVSRLDARGCRPRKDGKGWSAFCPVHERDGSKAHKPSLSIDQGADGRALLCCHAGCKTDAILEALGLSMVDLFSGSGTILVGNGKREIVAAYDYRDETGRLLYQVVRLHPKDFRQRQPGENGDWKWSVKGVRKVLYRLPELLGADPAKTVFIVEGEKDADRLAVLGLVATTNAGGAGKWLADYSPPLRARRVVVLPDNDEAGRDHAQHVAQSLHGVAASVRVVNLPGLAEKGDPSDWLDQGGTPEQLCDLAESAPEWKPTCADPSPMLCLADVDREEVRWLWPGRIPLGKLTLIQGDPDVGKSFLTLDIAARVSRGEPWPDFPGVGQPWGGVLLASAEDGVGDTIRPRLEAASADLARVFVLRRVSSLLANGLSEMEQRIRETSNARLVVIDPVSAYLGNTDSHKNAAVRGVLAPLASLADRFRVAVVCVTHLNKTADGPALYRASGSMAFSAAARAVWLAAKDKQSPERRLLLPIKNNLAPHAPGLAFRIVCSAIPDVGKIEWEPGPLSVRADEALASDGILNDKRMALQEAVAWLQEVLSEGPIRTTELQRMAREAGHAWGTVRRAKERLGGLCKHTGARSECVWYWLLPGHKWPPDSIDAKIP